MDEHYRNKNYGIAPRAISYLFQRLRDKTQATQSPYYIRVAYLEIYNEQVIEEKKRTNIFVKNI